MNTKIGEKYHSVHIKYKTNENCSCYVIRKVCCQNFKLSILTIQDFSVVMITEVVCLANHWKNP